MKKTYLFIGAIALLTISSVHGEKKVGGLIDKDTKWIAQEGSVCGR